MNSYCSLPVQNQRECLAFRAQLITPIGSN